jgi:two-component system, NarL family, response regulator NreC
MRVLLADDHQIFRQGLRELLENAGHEIVGEAADGREALKLARSLAPDVAVLDVSMPLLNGLDAACELRRMAPDTKTVLLTMYTDSCYVLQALRSGTKGYVLKTQAADDLISAIRAVVRGEMYLSPGISASVVDAYLHKTDEPHDPLTLRERQILQLVAEGKSSAEAAAMLFLSPKTVDTYRSRMMQKLGVSDLASLVKFAIQHGVTQLD